MGALFENTTVLTKELFLEAMDVRFKATRKKYRTITLILFILYILIALILFFVAAYVMGGIVLLLDMGFLLLYLKGYLLRANKAYQSQLALDPSGRTDYLFYDDRFESVTPLSRRSTDYAMITRFLETKSAFVLLFVEEFMVIEKSGFKAGDRGKFVDFLYGKCPGLGRYFS